MALLGKLLGMWLSERTVTSSTPLFMRLLAAIAAIAVLTAIAAALLALLLAGLLYLLYEQLIAHGLSPQLVLFSMLSVVVILLGIMAAIAQHYIDKIRALSRLIPARPDPVSSGVTTIAESFLRGLCKVQPAYYR